jgi:hypothetical protein
MTVPNLMPRRWRNVILFLAEWEDQLSCRLIHKIERLNRRVLILEAQRRYT